MEKRNFYASYYYYCRRIPTWFWRNRGDRRNTMKWHRQHHRRRDCPWSSARIVCFCLHRSRRPACTCLWRRSWALGSGSNGLRWRCYHASMQARPVLWGCGRNNQPYLEMGRKLIFRTSSILSLCQSFIVTSGRRATLKHPDRCLPCWYSYSKAPLMTDCFFPFCKTDSHVNYEVMYLIELSFFSDHVADGDCWLERTGLGLYKTLL